MKTADKLVIRELDGGSRFELVEPIEFDGQTQKFSIPAGYITDLASIPRLLQWVVPKLGSHNRAAVLHDVLWQLSKAYEEGRLSFNADGDYSLNGVSFPTNMLLDPVDVDGMFRRAMRLLGVSFPRRWLMWAAVRSAAIGEGRIGNMTLRVWGQLLGVFGTFAAPVAAVVAWLAGFGFGF